MLHTVMQEAIAAGNTVLADLQAVARALDGAAGWGVWDMVGGGLIATCESGLPERHRSGWNELHGTKVLRPQGIARRLVPISPYSFSGSSLVVQDLAGVL